MSHEVISVIGLGYIGLPTAAMFAKHGKKVVGVDINKRNVDIINEGKVHIIEPGLEAMVDHAVKVGNLVASTTVREADAFLIAVPTPFKSDSIELPTPDLSYVKSACESIAPVLQKGNLIVLESTSPVGTTEKMAVWLADLRPDLSFPFNHNSSSDVSIAYCPERVLPGKVVKELIENDRIIGGLTVNCCEKAVSLYRTFVLGECVVTNSRTAEMAKLVENASRDVSIAFANELSVICDEAGIDVWELIELANRHPRVNILQPGPGVGGHCIAVDPWFIVSQFPELAKIIKVAREVNDAKPSWVIEKVMFAVADYLAQHNEKSVSDIKIACYGLSFKPDIDDLRESPALEIAKSLTQQFKTSCVCVEPNISITNSPAGINLISTDKALSQANIHVLLVDHAEFKGIKKPEGLVIDTKGIWKN